MSENKSEQLFEKGVFRGFGADGLIADLRTLIADLRAGKVKAYMKVDTDGSFVFGLKESEPS